MPGKHVEGHFLRVHQLNDDIKTCAKIGRELRKPASGKRIVRVPPEVHAVALRVAALAGKSHNQLAEKIAKEAVQA